MKKNIILICCLTIFSFATQSMCFAFGLKGEKALKNHPEFVSIEEEWGTKLGTHYIVNLTDNRILEFDQINSGNGGGEYACLKRIGEFELRGFVQYINKNGEIVRGNTKESWSAYARFRDISQGMGVKIETMVDVINHYDEIISFFKMIANEQYISDDYAYHVDSENRKATIYVAYLNGYPDGLWHGIKEDEIPFNEDWGEWWCVSEYGENWRE
ncbi:MAG: hypothetical protein IKZ86_09915, partial [Spirochaetaceae bacterium]|nr:hypothetical protein [Spirochaetaceae bacterium]